MHVSQQGSRVQVWNPLHIAPAVPASPQGLPEQPPGDVPSRASHAAAWDQFTCHAIKLLLWRTGHAYAAVC